MPAKADPGTRAGLLAAARDLFLAGGFAATGVDEICRAARVTKGALFHHFDGKEGLALEVLSEWTRAGARAYSSAPFLSAAGAVERVLGYVDFTIALSREAPLGCLVGTLAQEVAASRPALRDACAASLRDWSDALASMLDLAQREAGVDPPFDGRSVASHFVAVFEGAQLLAKLDRSRAVVAEHLLHFRRYLEHLLGPARAAHPHQEGGTQ